MYAGSLLVSTPVREQRKLDCKELNFNEISKKASADPMGSSRTGVALESHPWSEGPKFYLWLTRW